jgi:predicted Zn-ribbon and HTH transcriptional regulator
MVDTEIVGSSHCPRCKGTNIKKEHKTTTKGYAVEVTHCRECKTETRTKYVESDYSTKMV